MGVVKFGKSAEEKPLAITSEVKELKLIVQDLLGAVNKSEVSAQEELARAAIIRATESKLEDAIKKFRKEQRVQSIMIGISAGTIIIIKLISLIGV
jgi:L-lactate utilization protein LutC